MSAPSDQERFCGALNQVIVLGIYRIQESLDKGTDHDEAAATYGKIADWLIENLNEESAKAFDLAMDRDLSMATVSLLGVDIDFWGKP